jgi:uncharacterized protein (DUF952 family)
MIILHITDPKTWRSALEAGEYTGDSLKKEGFIHCCMPEQKDQVLKNWFAGVANLLLVEIDTDRLSSKLVFENLEAGDEKFPHIYGPINLDAVINVCEID